MNGLNENDLKMLAKIERDMDSGKVAFVRDKNGNRWAFPEQVLQKFDCVSGQSVSEVILNRLLEAHVEHLSALVADKAISKFMSH